MHLHEHKQDVAVWKHRPASKIRSGDRRHFSTVVSTGNGPRQTNLESSFTNISALRPFANICWLGVDINILRFYVQFTSYEHPCHR